MAHKTWPADRAATGSIDPAVVRHLTDRGAATAEEIAAANRLRYTSVKSALRRLDGAMVVRCGWGPPTAGRRGVRWRRIAPGEWCRPGEVSPHPPGLRALVAQVEAMGPFVVACRDLLAAAEREHAEALAAVRRWAAENTDPVPEKGRPR